MGIKTSKPLWELPQLQGNQEYLLFESTIVEFTDISGIVVDYYIRDPDRENDYLYGEGPASRYFGPYKTKFVYEPTEEITTTTGYGINSEEVISFAFIPKFTFSRDVSGGYVPKPGDAVVTIWNDRAYEIADCGEEEKIFQLKKMIWELILRPYRFSDESESAKKISRFTFPPTDSSTISETISAFGDNKDLEDESDDIYDYEDNNVDTKIYGYVIAWLALLPLLFLEITKFCNIFNGVI